MHHFIHKHRKQAFCLDRIRRKPLEEVHEILLKLAEDPRGEAPEVHADRCEGIEQHARLARVDIADLAVIAELDLERFDNLIQIAIDRVADAAGNRSVLGNRVLQLIAHHGRFAFLRQGLQFVVNRAKRRYAVIVIRIDDGERLIDVVARNQHRVYRAERLGAFFRNVIERRNAGEILECVIDLHLLGDAVAADGSEHILHARLDDKDHMVKARANRVIDGILHQNLAVRTQTVHLLVSAVAGAHARSHNQKRCTHSNTSSSSNNRLILTYYTGFALFLQPQSPKFMKP